MNLSFRGLEHIKGYEKLRLVAYKPTPNDVWTCGWGSTEGVTKDTVWTSEQAEAALRRDVATAEQCVDSAVLVPLTQHEFDALVSLTFNIGCGAFRKSTLLKLLNNSDYDGASAQILRWNKQAGAELAGLTRRRETERALFEAG